MVDHPVQNLGIKVRKTFIHKKLYKKCPLLKLGNHQTINTQKAG
jgi:hypothetical protein